jgi:hypothetical protein
VLRVGEQHWAQESATELGDLLGKLNEAIASGVRTPLLHLSHDLALGRLLAGSNWAPKYVV